MDHEAGTETQRKLGDAVRRLRERAGFSQEQLAEHSGLHRTYVSQLERGHRNATVGTLVKLAAALSVTVAGLMAEAGL